MTELEKFKKVNQCETAQELADVVLSFADENGFIQGRSKTFDAVKMSKRVFEVVEGQVTPNTLTREFGIRQQALYINHYTQPQPGQPSEKPDLSDTIEELVDLSKMFDDRVSELYNAKGGQADRHAFIHYRSILWAVIKTLKQI